MSVVTYNGITLPYSHLTRFNQEAVYDESDTDRIYTKFNVQVQCILNSNYISLIAPDLIQDGSSLTTNPADIMQIIRQRLLRHRRPLSVKFNGSELIPKAQILNQGYVDAKNGPHPQFFAITKLTNTSYLCIFNVIAHYWENNTVTSANNGQITGIANNAGNNVLSNRWTESTQIDENQLTTRTRSGKFIIRSDNIDGFVADEMSIQMAVVGVPDGYTRKSSNYVVSPDGLSIQYTVVDREAYKLPPRPAYTATGDYTESGVRAGAAVRIGVARITLTGSPEVNQDELVRVAVTIVANKVGGRGTAFPLETHVKVDMYENKVEASIKALFTAPIQRVGGDVVRVAGFNKLMSFTPGTDDLHPDSPPYPLGGTDGLLIQAASYFDPSIRPNQMDSNGVQMQNGLEVGQAGKIKEE